MLLLLTLESLVIGSLPLQLDWLCTSPHLAPEADRLPLAHSSSPGLHWDDRSLTGHCTDTERAVNATHTCKNTRMYSATLWTFRQDWVKYSVNEHQPQSKQPEQIHRLNRGASDDKAKKDKHFMKFSQRSVKDIVPETNVQIFFYFYFPILKAWFNKLHKMVGIQIILVWFAQI